MLWCANLLERVAHAETRRQAPGRERLEGFNERSNVLLGRDVEIATAERPLLIVPASVGSLGKLEGIGPQIGNARCAMRPILTIPDIKAIALLRQERDLPLVVAEGGIVTIIVSAE